MPGEATETVPVTEQEMQQPQVETGSYCIIISHMHAKILNYRANGVLELKHCSRSHIPPLGVVAFISELYIGLTPFGKGNTRQLTLK